MNPVITKTKPLLSEIAKPLGFRSRGAAFFRVVGEVVQIFKIYARYESCSIRFILRPICGVFDNMMEGEDMSFLWSDKGSELYTVFLSVPESVELASQFLVEAFEEYLLPFFLKSDTLEKAFEAYNMIDVNLCLRRREEDTPEIREKLWKSALRQNCYGNFEWMMQMKRYDEAAEFLAMDIESLRRYENRTGYVLSYLPEYKEQWRKIAAHDMEYINQFMAEREAETFQVLKWKRGAV